jgi:hypothetical protein
MPLVMEEEESLLDGMEGASLATLFVRLLLKCPVSFASDNTITDTLLSKAE